jgi:hypothetical protein
VLADLAEHALRHHDLPRHHGRAPQIHVVVAASTLLGLDDEPADLAGAGPLTAHTARRIAADGTWRRLLTDPAGHLVDLSTDTHEPTQAQRDHVTTRDRTCQGPGCRTPAARCDLDHTLQWPTGPTTIANLSPLCRTHHRPKTLPDTHLTRHPDPHPDSPGPTGNHYGHGDLHWTLPTGQTHPRPPDPVLDHPALDPPALRNALRHANGHTGPPPPPASHPDPPDDDIPPF